MSNLKTLQSGTALDSVADSKNIAFSFPKYYTNEFLRLVNYLIDNNKLREERGRLGVDFCRENYSMKLYISGILDVYLKAKFQHNISEDMKDLLEDLKQTRPVLHKEINLFNEDSAYSNVLYQISPVLYKILRFIYRKGRIIIRA